ncbi:nitrate reductase [Histoplasma capsulatum H143]|uniref:Nitrate reductase n=1 Tax=Ajellomyces capsulatus (strain H143) TaxID=544712 RepID=C6HL06_AJECH|nr:nitrate reductase [Histoplasma capsulatum H143]
MNGPTEATLLSNVIETPDKCAPERMRASQQLQFGNDWIDEEFVSNHVVGIVALRKVVDKYTPEYVEKITGVPKAQLQETVEIVGMTPPLPYTTLQVADIWNIDTTKIPHWNQQLIYRTSLVTLKDGSVEMFWISRTNPLVGIQWPYAAEYLYGKERLFEDGKYFTDADYCESFGHDLETCVPCTKQRYMEMSSSGGAIFANSSLQTAHGGGRRSAVVGCGTSASWHGHVG